MAFTFMILSELPEEVYCLELVLASIVLSISTEELRQVSQQKTSIHIFSASKSIYWNEIRPPPNVSRVYEVKNKRLDLNFAHLEF